MSPSTPNLPPEFKVGFLKGKPNGDRPTRPGSASPTPPTRSRPTRPSISAAWRSRCSASPARGCPSPATKTTPRTCCSSATTPSSPAVRRTFSISSPPVNKGGGTSDPMKNPYVVWDLLTHPRGAYNLLVGRARLSDHRRHQMVQRGAVRSRQRHRQIQRVPLLAADAIRQARQDAVLSAKAAGGPARSGQQQPPLPEPASAEAHGSEDAIDREHAGGLEREDLALAQGCDHRHLSAGLRQHGAGGVLRTHHLQSLARTAGAQARGRHQSRAPRRDAGHAGCAAEGRSPHPLRPARTHRQRGLQQALYPGAGRTSARFCPAPRGCRPSSPCAPSRTGCWPPSWSSDWRGRSRPCAG